MTNKGRKLLAATAVTLAGLATIPGVAAAGERAGNGKPVTVNARSDCAYSGLEDFDFEAPVQPGVVQNWGHVKRALGLTGGANEVTLVIPGVGEVTTGCNAHLYPLR